MAFYPRLLKKRVLEAFQNSPVTLLKGPRQVGKTMLIQELAQALNMHYLTLDTLQQLAIAQEDPEGFIAGIQTPVIIDEVQRAPQIALPIKAAVDRNRKPGLFGLTGSANPLAAPKLNDSLAGRMFILHLWPLAQVEILQNNSTFLDLLFDKNSSFKTYPLWSRQEMINVFLAGGYPPALELTPPLREQWFDNLLTTILERDVRDLAHITKPRDLLKLLSILATRSGQLLNLAEIGRLAEIPYATLTHYMTLLEALFLVMRLPPWHMNRTKRTTKMPKLYFGDTGLLTSQLRVGIDSLQQNGRFLGSVLETFVFLELSKLCSFESRSIELYHFRTQTEGEVDFVLENRQGQIVGVEVKASETLSVSDGKWLQALEEEAGELFVRGVILYPGKEIVSLGKHRHAIPLSCLWN